MLYYLKNFIYKIMNTINNKKKNIKRNNNINKNFKDIKIVSNYKIYTNIKNKTFSPWGELYILRKFSI
jgi:hypothetical protein